MMMKYGSRGEDVKLLQEKLSVKADGIFGQKTKEAVKAFQKANGLAVDGIAGPKTLAALGIAQAETVIPCEDLKQYSLPHGDMIYGPDRSYSTYRSGGCGIAAFAIVQRAYGLAPKTEKATQTIQRLGRFAWEHGYRIKGGGTSAGLFSTNGIKARRVSSASAIENAIREGKLVILHIKKGFPNGYGGKGHYAVAYGIRGEELLLRDVGSSASSRQRAKLASVTKGLKAAYIMEKRG